MIGEQILYPVIRRDLQTLLYANSNHECSEWKTSARAVRIKSPHDWVERQAQRQLDAFGLHHHPTSENEAKEGKARIH